MKNIITVAACQLPDIHEDIKQALKNIVSYALKAKFQDAKLVCFPECYLQGYIVNHQTHQLAINLSSDAFESILYQLANIRPVLVIGLIERDNQKIFNTPVVIKEGQLLGRYRKVKLLDGEKGVFEAGSEFPVFETEGLTFGINICYDLNFSECTQAVASQGANLLVCPCNNMMRYENAEKWKDKHNESRAERAKEGRVWLMSSDVTGEREGRISYGPTAVINPQGLVVTQIPLLKGSGLKYMIGHTQGCSER
jgi:5-aminopentanamidase